MWHLHGIIYKIPDHQIDALKIKAHFKNAFGCIPFLAMEAKSRNQNDIWIADHPLVLPLFFCQTVSSISTKGAWTPNLMFWKWTHILKMLLAASPFLPWRLKVEIKRIYEIADHALAPPQFFCQTVSSISTKGAWTPNLMFWKWMHILKMLLAASPFFPWRLKVEIKRIYEIADHALAPPQFFGKTVNPISTKRADCAH